MNARYLLLCVALVLPVAARAETPPSDPKAIAIADQIMQSLGGQARWDSLRGIRWSFGFESNDTVRSLRRHSWDKHTGWHRVEGKNRAGQTFIYVENMNDSTTGMAWVNGIAIEGDSLKKLMKQAKRMWTNDTYWMLMPYKLRDPGVMLKAEGQVRDSATGKMYDRVALSFDNVGQTPGDRYWIFVNPTNHRIEKWEYVLEGEKPPASQNTWEDYRESGGLWFPNAHRRPGGNIFTRDVETVTEFRPTEFTAP
jgi:hypothetical protein